MLNARDARGRLQAAYTLLQEPTTTRQKFSSVRQLIRGVNPRLDEALARVEGHLATWDKIESGDVIHLSAEQLPENTEEQKKRKKWLLLLIVHWKHLGSEVARVQSELDASQGAQSAGQQVSTWGRIFGFAKGPFGIITIVAAGIVVTMQATAVGITIENRGCDTMYPSTSVPISIPGLKLPSEPIEDGGSAEVTLPGVTVSVDGSQPGVVTLSLLNYSLGFQIPGDVADVTLNGTSLLGTQTTVALSEREQHTIVLRCL